MVCVACGMCCMCMCYAGMCAWNICLFGIVCTCVVCGMYMVYVVYSTCDMCTMSDVYGMCIWMYVYMVCCSIWAAFYLCYKHGVCGICV